MYIHVYIYIYTYITGAVLNGQNKTYWTEGCS